MKLLAGLFYEKLAEGPNIISNVNMIPKNACIVYSIMYTITTFPTDIAMVPNL